MVHHIKHMARLDDFIVEIENFISKTECEELIDIHKSSQLFVFKGQMGGNDVEDESIKQSTDLHLHFCDHSNALELEEKYNKKLTEIMNEYVDIVTRKHPQYSGILQRYLTPKDKNNYTHTSGVQVQLTSPGQQFKWHADYGESSMGRMFAFIVYLNDVNVDFEGGYTEFEHRRVVPEAGKLLIFPIDTFLPGLYHRGVVVESGAKYIFTAFLARGGEGIQDDFKTKY
tara:strand:+ start:217 stop:900 length:684 start_codon:yes stop_codon:yes gene_type:complete